MIVVVYVPLDILCVLLGQCASEMMFFGYFINFLFLFFFLDIFSICFSYQMSKYAYTWVKIVKNCVVARC